MIQSEFIEITEEIEKFYDKELSIEQRKIWFEELKYLTKERYKQVIKECYKTLKFMPKLADIIEINKSLQIATKKDNTSECKCSKCNETGIVIYTKIIDKISYVYGARCNCQNGLKQSYKIPDIDKVGIAV